MIWCHRIVIGEFCYTDKKRRKFSSRMSGNSEGSGAKSYMTNDLIIYGENICAFPHILGIPSSYMTLHPDPIWISLYMRKILFSFLSVYTGSLPFQRGFPSKSMWVRICDVRSDYGRQHKVRIYRVPQYMSPRRNWDSPAPSLASEFVCPSPESMGGAHSPADEGLGESQFRRLEKRLSTLPTLWETGSGSFYSI